MHRTLRTHIIIFADPEGEDTLMMISHGVEISIAGCGADEKDGRK